MVPISFLTAILTYIIGLCGITPLFPWLTIFPRAILVIGIILGLWQDRRGIWLLKPWMQNVTVVPVFFYYAVQFSRSNPIQPVISVLAIMLAVRLSGEKTVRHSLQIYALSLFCLASSSLFDLSPVFLIYLGVILFVVAIALVLLTFLSQEPAMSVTIQDLKRILLSSLLMPILAAPLVLVFFPILPRTQLPLWLFLNPPTTRSTGYSDTVEPGSQSSIADSRTLAFRVEMPHLNQTQLYWRGTVFNRTDGLKWTRLEQIPTEQPAFTGQVVTQEIYPEPSSVRTLISLDRPVSLSLQRVKRSPDGVFTQSGSVGRRTSYKADSQSSGLIAQGNKINKLFYLQLPEKVPVRIKTLALEIVRSGGNDGARVEYLERYFRNGNYRYSMKDLPTGVTALEQFLFDRKQGHCEFFASSFALLLRAAGIPSRLVGGFLGGEYNQLGGYYLVTDDKAHVWVEVYIEGSGWIRIDPSRFASNAGDVWIAPGTRSLKLSVFMAIDSLNHAWNRSVISYDFEQQMNVIQHVSSRFQGIQPTKIMGRFVPYFVVIILLVGLFYAAWRASIFTSREQRILRRFLHTVESGYVTPTAAGGAGLFEISLAADNKYVSDFVAIYAGAVYRDRRLSDDEYQSLQQIMRSMRDKNSKIP